MDNLLPCPFCGSDRVTVWNVQNGQQAICKDCKSNGRPCEDWLSAVKAWNTRPPQDRVEAFVSKATRLAGYAPFLDREYLSAELNGLLDDLRAAINGKQIND